MEGRVEIILPGTTLEPKPYEHKSRLIVRIAEIAEYLVVAEQTVKTHVGRILVKLGLMDRTHAAGFAFESGLVRPSGR